MSTSTRFAVATHILAMLAAANGAPVTSERLAASIGANPAFIRKILSTLAGAGLVTTQLGKGGGAVLRRSPKKISLLDVFAAVESATLIAAPRSRPDPDCPVGREINRAFADAVRPAEDEFFRALKAVSLKRVLKKLDAIA